MADSVALQQFLIASARRFADKVALEDPGKGNITYGELNALTDRLRDCLARLGTRPGDRVGFYLRKSIDSIASIYGILKAGAAYVPVDPGAPVTRNAYIFANCAVRVVIVEKRFAEPLRAALAELSGAPHAGTDSVVVSLTPFCFSSATLLGLFRIKYSIN
jgi:acyl-CoA synthetase (AMP-forming)/AMP-acid ligase II